MLMVKHIRVWWIVTLLTYVSLGVLINNPKLVSSLLKIKIELIEYMADSSNVIAWLGAIAAIASGVAAFLSFQIAKSSRDIAQNALGFQYHESVKESIELIASTLITIKTNTVKVGDIIETPTVNYSLSLKRTDWIFVAQEVANIINLLDFMAVDNKHKERLMERYGRILHIKLCPTSYGKKTGIFTAGKPDDSFLDREFAKKTKNIRDKDLFTLYLFTEEYDSYKMGSGQYPVSNRCCYFHTQSCLELS